MGVTIDIFCDVYFCLAVGQSVLVLVECRTFFASGCTLIVFFPYTRVPSFASPVCCWSEWR